VQKVRCSKLKELLKSFLSKLRQLLKKALAGKLRTMVKALVHEKLEDRFPDICWAFEGRLLVSYKMAGVVFKFPIRYEKCKKQRPVSAVAASAENSLRWFSEVTEELQSSVGKLVRLQRKARYDREDYKLLEDLEPQIQTLNFKTAQILLGKFRQALRSFSQPKEAAVREV
jgi:hypothetical protein